MADSDTTTTATKSKKDNRKWIIYIIIAAVVAGGLGYVIGGNIKEAEMRQKYNLQVNELEEDASSAKQNANSALEEGQQEVAEGQQTLEALQNENATLKATIESQNAKIADLEQQLKEAQESDTTTPENP
jgi:peptidoglycan hydrolase CwlO-like protein